MTDISQTRDNVIRDIKRFGHWEFRLHPTFHEDTRFAPHDIGSRIRQSTVDLRWPFPHWEGDVNGLNLANCIDRWTAGYRVFEFWRATTSGQFYMLQGLVEDRFPASSYESWGTLGVQLRGKKWLGTLGMLYSLTEALEFIRRYTSKSIHYESWTLSIALRGNKERRLVLGDFHRINVVPSSLHPPVSSDWSYRKQESTQGFQLNAKVISFEAFQSLLHYYNWNNPPVKVFEDLQEKFLNRQTS